MPSLPPHRSSAELTCAAPPGTDSAGIAEITPTPPASQRGTIGAKEVSRPRWRSAELFGNRQEIEIEHGLAVYRLRLTSLGKLILTK